MAMTKTVTVPVSAGIVYGKIPPRLSSKGDIVQVRGCEVAVDVELSTTVATQTLQCATFGVGDWLANLSLSWAKWRWLQLRFVYIPVVSTQTAGSFHMGLLYDQLDIVPTAVRTFSATSHYTTGPVWNGSAAANCLHKYDSPMPPSAVCIDVDLSRMNKREWCRTVTQASFATELAKSPVLGNMMSPARLVYQTRDATSSTAVTCGRIYCQYVVEFTETIALVDNE